MKAMVLAAGLGTRLRPFTDTRPKALAEIAGRTLLEITLTRIRAFGVNEVIINVHHFADMVVDYLKSHNNFGMRIEISREDDLLLDTGGGLKKAAWFFLDDPSRLDEPFLLHNVDVISNIDLHRMLQFHNEHRALATLAVQSRESSRLLLFDDDLQLCGRRISGQDTLLPTWGTADVNEQEKQIPRYGRNDKSLDSPLPLAFSGIHIISPRLLPMLTETGAFSIIDSYLRLASQREKILAFRADGYYWRDLGRPLDLSLAASDLKLGIVEQQRPTDQQNTGRAYTKRLRWSGEIRFLAFFVAVLAYSLSGLHKFVATAAETITSNFYLQVFLCWIPLWAASVLASFPVTLYRFYLGRKFQLIKSGVRQWLWDSFKANVVALVLGTALIEIAFSSNTMLPSYGWIVAGLLSSVLFVAVNQFVPWLLSLFYPVLPLSNPVLSERLTRLVTKAGLRVGTIYEWRISGRTRAANALVAGVGSARRILLTDTLIAELSEDEVQAIVAHELGHCALHHVRKRLLLQSLIFIAMFGIIQFAVRHDLVAFVDQNYGWKDLRLLPGFFLYWNCAYIYGHILLFSLSRRQERSADLYSWQLIGRAEPFITAMRKLTDLNLLVFDKNSEWKYMHPATSDRIAAAEQYARANGETLAAPMATVTVSPGSS